MINNVYTLYSHDDIFQWYTSYTDQKLKPNRVKHCVIWKYLINISNSHHLI